MSTETIGTSEASPSLAGRRRVGFIGLGTQGKPLARNLVAPGVDLMVHDVRDDPIRELVAAGAKGAPSAAAVARHAEVLFICVVNDAQVEAIVAGEHGVLSACRPGTVLAVHSTVSPGLIRRLGGLAEAAGVKLIDAPVSGGAEGAAARKMSFMVAGDPAAIDVCEPLLRLSGDAITRTGPLGTAAAAKLAHQVVLCGNMMAVAEGMRLAEAAGLDFDVARQIFSAGAAQSRIADMWGAVDGSAAEPIFYKDLALSLAVAREVGVHLPATAFCQQTLSEVLPSRRPGVRK